MYKKNAGTKAGKNITHAQYSRLAFLLALSSTCGIAAALLVADFIDWLAT